MNIPHPHLPALPDLPGSLLQFDGPAGRIGCYVAGRGSPLLLVHSVNAAASAAEMRPLFERYQSTRTVFAVDLPGFGSSERSDRDYTPALMTAALHSTVDQIRHRCGPGPVDALALSLGCEFLARAACEAPAHFGALAFVSPTGLEKRRDLHGRAGGTRAIPGLYPLLKQPMWSAWIYRQLARPRVVRYFLERTWGSREIDETVWEHAVRNARQPGARHAPLAFVAGRLFSTDIQRIYERLRQPVWLSHGTRGDFTDFGALARLARLARWRQQVFPTGALPFFEMPGEFGAAFDAFLGPASQSLRAPSLVAPRGSRAAAAWQ